jgi:peptidoglycan/LPS O-acetylase OafA/YrhL
VRGFRPDIEGLRAIAVLLVVLDHAHVPGIRAGYVGVDVFFVISGFLITRQLTDELTRKGKVSLLAFYGRRAKRLLPASALVTVATVVAATQLLSPLRARSVLADAVSTTYYGLNYRLAAEGTNYLTASAPPSPLQHYWSLAVEEQFYLVWPLLVLAAVLVAPRLRHRVLGVVLGTVAVGSLAAGVVLTGRSQPWAYFSLPTRAWELGAGALVALSVPTLTRLHRAPAVLLGWAGLGAVLASAGVLSDSTPYPGWYAMLPVLGATAVVVSGCSGARQGPESLLRLAPMQWIGKVSYAWYLWHWPALILVPAYLGHDLTVVQGLEVSAATLLVATVSYHVVENPLRSWVPLVARPVRGTVVGLVLTGVLFATATGAGRLIAPLDAAGQAAHISTASPRASFGSVVHATVARSIDMTVAPRNLTPSVTAAPDDVPESQRDGCHQLGFDVVRPTLPCMYGDVSSHSTVVLYGDSHAAQWLPALDALGRAHHWRIASRTKVSCPATDVHVNNTALHREYHECDQWRVATIAEIATLHPAVVMMASAVSVGADDISDVAWAAGTARTVHHFEAMGARVVLLADTARTKSEGVDCLAAHLDDVSTCRLPASIAYYYPNRRAADIAAAQRAGAAVVDPDPWFCANGWCPAVVGPYVVFRDSSHMTATYARWLAPALLEQLKSSSATTAALGLKPSR